MSVRKGSKGDFVSIKHIANKPRVTQTSSTGCNWCICLQIDMATLVECIFIREIPSNRGTWEKDMQNISNPVRSQIGGLYNQFRTRNESNDQGVLTTFVGWIQSITYFIRLL